MELDPSDILLKKARDDARLLSALQDSTEASTEQMGFFAQQAVEKSIKFVLTIRGVPYRRTHDLAELLDLLKQHKIPFPDDLRQSVLLTPFAVQFRYDDLPEAEDTQNPFDRLAAVQMGQAALEWAETFATHS